MNSSKNNWRDLLALLIAVASLFGLWVMFNAEGSVWLVTLVGGQPEEILNPLAISKQFEAVIKPGLQQYSLAIGVVLFAVSISYILLGAQEEISTALDEPKNKQ
jgi:hypothetical protein